MARTNKHKATIILGLVFLGLAASLPFSRGFAGGLFASGFAAALVGGLADWFAIAALFRRPLGIPFRTAVIPRNRDRITQAITDMVEKELLTRDNIQATLSRYDMAALIVSYLLDYGGKAHIRELLQKIGDDALPKINFARIGQFLAALITTQAGKVSAAVPLAQALTWSVNHGYFDLLIDFAVGELRLLAGQPQARSLLAGFIGEARTVYERSMRRRRLAGQVLDLFGLTAAGLAGLVQQKAVAFLAGLQDAGHPLRIELRRKAACFAASLAADERRQQSFEQWTERLIAADPALARRIGDMLRDFLAEAAGDGGRLFVHKWLDVQVETLLADFRQNPGRQQALGDLARRGLLLLIDTHHGAIGAIVRERLNQYSTPALVEFIETRVGNDLQMIRINGSIVGGLAGMLIFLFTRWWGL